jgi:hypothetical protein
MNVNYFSESSNGKTDVKAMLWLAAHVPVKNSKYSKALALMQRSCFQVPSLAA